MTTPQIPFITAPVKRTDDVDWVQPLKKYIARFYQDDPDKYTEETQAFNRLRQDIRGAGKDITGRDLLYRYFGQLELLDLRFPVDEKHVKVLFNWYDAFNNRAVAQYSLAFEKASIIFNEAATLSAIASAQNRAEAEGRKRAFHYFQASAGMFQYINDNFLHAPSEDLCRESVQMLCELMLTQAHECFLETSIREKNKTGLIAKLASHATWAYGHLVDSLNDAIQRGAGTDKAWVTICQVKQKYYAALAQQSKAIACEIETKYGESVARHSAAESAAKEAVKLNQSLNSLLNTSGHAAGTVPSECAGALQELCKTLSAQCSEKVTLATRDNDMIYHDAVPQESVLVPIDRLKAVKTTPMTELYGPDEIKKVIGADLFSKLIPISIHESASLYSEEKAKLLRSENERCDLAQAELNASLDYMKLPAVLAKFKQRDHLDSYASAPQEAILWSEEIWSEEMSRPLRDLLQSFNTMKSRARQALDNASLSLDTEMRACEQARVQYGDFWTQTPSGSLTTEFRHDLANHRKILDDAHQSDQQLFSRYASVQSSLDILKQPSQLEKTFTDSIIQLSSKSSDASNMNLLDVQIETEDTANQMNQKIQQVESILEKLRRIESDRSETFNDLKEKTTQDDISQLLILNKKANVEEQIFASELEKFRPYQHRISATIQHQQQAIQDLTEAFKKLMEGHEAQKLHSQNEKAEKVQKELMRNFEEARATYREVKEDSGKGLQFYNGLQDKIESLKCNIDRFLSERTAERNRLIQDIENTKSVREQALLKETLNKYTSPIVSSAPPIDQLANQTRQISLHEPGTSQQYTPTPPPKPQGILQPSYSYQPVSSNFSTPRPPHDPYLPNTYRPPQTFTAQTPQFHPPPPGNQPGYSSPSPGNQQAYSGQPQSNIGQTLYPAQSPNRQSQYSNPLPNSQPIYHNQPLGNQPVYPNQQLNSQPAYSHQTLSNQPTYSQQSPASQTAYSNQQPSYMGQQIYAQGNPPYSNQPLYQQNYSNPPSYPVNYGAQSNQFNPAYKANQIPLNNWQQQPAPQNRPPSNNLLD
ncbi:BRO1-like domain-containing protein [Sporodiniella umbellata]|nr:BRO1-like domain-containing protein [Sporodiniella umbellata]